MQSLTREQILALVYNAPEAAAQLIETLFTALQRLRERVQAIEKIDWREIVTIAIIRGPVTV